MRRNDSYLLNPVFLAGAILVASGLFHLAWMWATGAAWSGPLSPRKPSLFGISGGITIWSIAWVLKQCNPFRYDQAFSRLMAGGLLTEVGLITIQFWRGVPSHFNRATILDSAIESTMLVLIFLVTAGVAWLCWRSFCLVPMAEARSIAIRAGLWLLLVSCGLGFMTTILGNINIANGRSPETWGRAGVLKYPHGAALHAIQTLPMVAALLHGLNVSNSAKIIRQLVFSHIFFLGYAIWQTLRGRSRFEVDLVGGALLIVSISLLMLPIGAVLFELISKAYRSRSTSLSQIPQSKRSQ